MAMMTLLRGRSSRGLERSLYRLTASDQPLGDREPQSLHGQARVPVERLQRIGAGVEHCCEALMVGNETRVRPIHDDCRPLIVELIECVERERCCELVRGCHQDSLVGAVEGEAGEWSCYPGQVEEDGLVEAGEEGDELAAAIGPQA